MTMAAQRKLRARSGQAMVEFAIAVPIVLLLAVGGIEFGRGYSAAVATSDAARDGARLAAGKTAAGTGPGLAAICTLVTADLATLTATVTCPVSVGHPPPFVSGVDFAPPVGGRAVVVVYCGVSLDCQGAGNRLYQSEVDVYVYYGFNDVNLLGGAFTIPGSSRSTTSW